MTNDQVWYLLVMLTLLAVAVVSTWAGFLARKYPELEDKRKR